MRTIPDKPDFGKIESFLKKGCRIEVIYETKLPNVITIRFNDPVKRMNFLLNEDFIIMYELDSPDLTLLLDLMEELGRKEEVQNIRTVHEFAKLSYKDLNEDSK